MSFRDAVIKLAHDNPGGIRRYLVPLLREATAAPSYQDYVDKKKKDGEKPLGKDEWERKVLNKGKEEKPKKPEKGKEEKPEKAKGLGYGAAKDIARDVFGDKSYSDQTDVSTALRTMPAGAFKSDETLSKALTKVKALRTEWQDAPGGDKKGQAAKDMAKELGFERVQEMPNPNALVHGLYLAKGRFKALQKALGG